ncbi:hypothetical protein L7F22_041372 [Adiantum nelumboides]|nr:hypothetical protein [Adiantum nelumboides]
MPSVMEQIEEEGFRSKRHMKLVLKWMKDKQQVKTVCQHLSELSDLHGDKEFLYAAFDHTEAKTDKMDSHSDDTVHSIVHTSDVPLSTRNGKEKYLADVLHVPNITKNMVFIGQMVEQGLQVRFNGDGLYVEEYNKNGKLVAQGKKVGRMFTLNVNMPKMNAAMFAQGSGAVADVEIWHKWIGHANVQRLKLMQSKELVTGVAVAKDTGDGEEEDTGNGMGVCAEFSVLEEKSGLVRRVHYPFTLGFGPSVGTQGSATQDPHITASDSSSDFDVMDGYPTQQYCESSSQDMHALGQPPGFSMFSHLKETLSRATRSEHATNEINEVGEEVVSSFTSQIDPVLSESADMSTPTTISIGPLKLISSETLLHDGRSLTKVQEVERYILVAREREIESLRKAEQRRALLAKALMTSALSVNPLQFPELTALKSQTIESHIASSSKDTPNTSILDGVFLNKNWEYNLQTRH